MQKLIALLFRSTCLDMTIYNSIHERYDDEDDDLVALVVFYSQFFHISIDSET